MKIFLKTLTLSMLAGVLFTLDINVSSPFTHQVGIGLVPEAHAILGVRRRAVRRGVVIGSSIAATNTAAATSASYTTNTNQPVSAPPAPSAPEPAATMPSKPLPLGTVVSSLPGNCSSTPVDGVNYYYCGGNFYRTMFQGNQVVYVTAKP